MAVSDETIVRLQKMRSKKKLPPRYSMSHRTRRGCEGGSSSSSKMWLYRIGQACFLLTHMITRSLCWGSTGRFEDLARFSGLPEDAE